MNTNRIEVPFNLPEPHFEDEATIATARQVVPIQHARRIAFWRKLRTALPIFLAATFCGGLGAAAVNYYEHWHNAAVAKEQAPVLNGPQTVSSPVAVASSAGAVGGKEMGSPTNSDGSQDSPATVQAAAKSDAGESDRTAEIAAETSVSPADKKNSDSDAAKLTRKRRVHPPDESAPAAKRNGAGKIVDVFTGPNP